jgi:hypothetical protein
MADSKNPQAMRRIKLKRMRRHYYWDYFAAMGEKPELLEEIALLVPPGWGANATQIVRTALAGENTRTDEGGGVSGGVVAAENGLKALEAMQQRGSIWWAGFKKGLARQIAEGAIGENGT